MDFTKAKGLCASKILNVFLAICMTFSLCSVSVTASAEESAALQGAVALGGAPSMDSFWS